MLDAIIDIYILFLITIGFLALAVLVRAAFYIVMEDIEDKRSGY